MAAADGAETAPLTLAVTIAGATEAASSNAQFSRSGHTASQLDGHILVFGGRASDGTCLNSVEAIPAKAAAQASNGRFLRWIALEADGVAPDGRFGHGACDVEGRGVFIFGGCNAKQLFQDLWELQYSGGNTCKWSLISAHGLAPTARMGHSMTYLRHCSSLLAFGGFANGKRSQAAYSDEVWLFDLRTSSWSEPTLHLAPSLSLSGRLGAPMLPLCDGTKVLIVGGSRQRGPLAEVLLLDTRSWQVSQGAPLCVPRAHATALHLPPYVLVIGGAEAGLPLAEALVLDPAVRLPPLHTQQTCAEPLQPRWREVRVRAKSAALSAARAKHSLSLLSLHWARASCRRGDDGDGEVDGVQDGIGGGGSGGVRAIDDGRHHHACKCHTDRGLTTRSHDDGDGFEVQARSCAVCGKCGSECAVFEGASVLLLGGEDGDDDASTDEGGTRSSVCNGAGHGRSRGASAFLLYFTNSGSLTGVPRCEDGLAAMRMGDGSDVQIGDVGASEWVRASSLPEDLFSCEARVPRAAGVRVAPGGIQSLGASPNGARRLGEATEGSGGAYSFSQNRGSRRSAANEVGREAEREAGCEVTHEVTREMAEGVRAEPVWEGKRDGRRGAKLGAALQGCGQDESWAAEVRRAARGAARALSNAQRETEREADARECAREEAAARQAARRRREAEAMARAEAAACAHAEREAMAAMALRRQGDGQRGVGPRLPQQSRDNRRTARVDGVCSKGAQGRAGIRQETGAAAAQFRQLQTAAPHHNEALRIDLLGANLSSAIPAGAGLALSGGDRLDDGDGGDGDMAASSSEGAATVELAFDDRRGIDVCDAAKGQMARVQSEQGQRLRDGEFRQAGEDVWPSQGETTEDEVAVPATGGRSGRDACRERERDSSAFREGRGGRVAGAPRHQKKAPHSGGGGSRCSCGGAEGRLASTAVGDDLVGAVFHTSVNASGAMRDVLRGEPACAAVASDVDGVSMRVARAAARSLEGAQTDVRRALVSEEAQRRRQWRKRAVKQLDGAVGEDGDDDAAAAAAMVAAEVGKDGLTRDESREGSRLAANGIRLQNDREMGSLCDKEDFLDMKAAAAEARVLSRLGAKISARELGTASDPGERLSADGRPARTRDDFDRPAVGPTRDGAERTTGHEASRQEAAQAAQAERARSRLRSFVRGSPAPRLRQLHYERLAFMARQVDAAKREAEAWAAMVAADAATEVEKREQQRVAHLTRSTDNGTLHAARSASSDTQQDVAAQARASADAPSCSSASSAEHTAQIMRNVQTMRNGVARAAAVSAASSRGRATFAGARDADGAASSRFATPTTQCSRSPHGTVEAATPRPRAPPRARTRSASPSQFCCDEDNFCIQPVQQYHLPLVSHQDAKLGLRAAQGVRRSTSGTPNPAQAERVLILQSQRLAEFQAEIQRMRQDWSQAMSPEPACAAESGVATWPPKSRVRSLTDAEQRTPNPSARGPQRALSGCCELLDRGLECTRRALLDYCVDEVTNVDTDTKWVQTSLLDDEMDALRQRSLEATRRADDAERAIGVLQEALVAKAAEATELRRALQAEKARHAAAAVAVADTNAANANDELRRRVQTLTLQLEASEERTLKGEKLVRKLREYLEHSQAHGGDLKRLK